MNFISSTSIYVFYPQLTLCSRYLINPSLPYKCCLKRDVLSFLLKYNEHNFCVCHCASIHNYPSPCKTFIRDASDSWTLRFPLPVSPSLPPPGITSFPSGKKHIIWKLGGFGCTQRHRLVWPYVRTRCKPVRLSLFIRSSLIPYQLLSHINFPELNNKPLLYLCQYNYFAWYSRRRVFLYLLYQNIPFNFKHAYSVNKVPAVFNGAIFHFHYPEVAGRFSS